MRALGVGSDINRYMRQSDVLESTIACCPSLPPSSSWKELVLCSSGLELVGHTLLDVACWVICFFPEMGVVVKQISLHLLFFTIR